MARAVPFFTRSTQTFTGAAQTWLVVNMPATVAGASDTMSERSRFWPLSEPLPVPRRLMSQNTPLARNPRGATTDPLMIFNFEFMVTSPVLHYMYFNLAAQVKHGFAANSDAVSRLFTEKFSATPGNLAGEKFRLSEPVRPVRNQGAVRRAGDGIFGNAGRRGEEARNEVAILAGSGGDNPQSIQRSQRFEIRLQRTHPGFRWK